MIPERQSNRKHLAKLIVLLAISIFLVSCETVSYYTQAARGQLAIVFGREDIQRLISDSDLSPELRSKFGEVMSIREFAENDLELPVANNYSTYVDVDREHVVWNVFAAPEFSTDPVNWCYPIAGCVAYRGYFSEAGALNYAMQLEEQGFDVYTGGVDAYSTLGWFEDSLLSTVMSRANYQLAGLIFHEMAHQIAYLPGDTTFNESFATAVEREGLRRWLEATDQAETIAVAETDRGRQQQFIDLVIGFRDQFDELYAEEMSEADKRREKFVLQGQLRSEYEQLKQSWGGYSGYDSWFSRSLNNAQLSTVSSYNDLVPFFDDLLSQAGHSLPAFYDEVIRIVALPEMDRDALLEKY
ncbi:MAG: aminopeptidase [Gammaproteobacteria bacterium]|nr:aminopeptidase [Gammaproteobacteria bacterium]MDD9896150.1 aminopeptidase [Gammaproteobacteria bacterium]MDD9959865.1 aminopeptidase [Gammaproteobacteria bacterium]